MKSYRKLIYDYSIALVVLLILNFLLPRWLPGNPLMAFTGGGALRELSPEMLLQLKTKMGLEQSLMTQFIQYLKQLMTLDFGYSYQLKKAVMPLVLNHFKWTLLLVGVATLLTLVVGYRIGVESAYAHRRKKDSLLMTIMIFISGFPQFFIGMMLLIVFSFKLHWLPFGGAESLYSSYQGLDRLMDISKHLVLPVVTIILSELTAVYMMTRSYAISVTEAPYMRTGRAKGLPTYWIKHVYLGKNVMIQLLPTAASLLGRLMVGVLMIEIVFSYPGIGTLIYNAIGSRDYPVLQSAFFLLAFLITLMNALAEAMYLRYKTERT